MCIIWVYSCAFRVIESRLNSRCYPGQTLLALYFKNEIHYCTLPELKIKKKIGRKIIGLREKQVTIILANSPPFSEGITGRS